MKIHEYQAKELLTEYGIPCQNGILVADAAGAVQAARALGGSAWVLKAQVHTGGRGKAGGVQLAHGLGEAEEKAQKMLGMQLVTGQTGPEGKTVRRLLVCRALEIEKEYYLSLVLDAANGCVKMIASQAGGMDIEETARTAPEKMLQCAISPDIGLRAYQVLELADGLKLNQAETGELVRIAQALYRLFMDKDCSLIEINPLALTGDGSLTACDAKMVFDDNALFLHPQIEALRDPEEEDPREAEAAKHQLNYVQLGGNIGCMVNGAGLAMATMDILQACGGRPANFLDVGGSATEERIARAFTLLLSDPNVEGILINIFGGIMRCDVVAAGIVEAAKKTKLQVPLVVRLAGTNAQQGMQMLYQAGICITLASDMAEGARKICALVASGKEGAR